MRHNEILMFCPTEDQIRLIAEACDRFAVLELNLFGSALTADWTPTSDLDMLVTFGSVPAKMTPSQQFFGFHEELVRILGVSVDLLEERAIRNARFRENAMRNTQRLYAA